MRIYFIEADFIGYWHFAQIHLCKKFADFTSKNSECYKRIVSMYKGIIFDFDGVIVDSEVRYVESVIAYLKTLGIDSHFDELTYLIGQNMSDIYMCLKRQFDLDVSKESFISNSMKVYEQLSDIKTFEPMNGLKEFLEYCHDKDLVMSVASSSSYDYLYTIMDTLGITRFFTHVISGDSLKHSKPDPEIYNLVTEEMGLNKKELMIIEDSVNGIRAGKASGIFTVGFKGSRIIQDTSMADREVYSFREIKDILEQ